MNYTSDGVQVRNAKMQDVAPLLRLINGFAQRGIMLPRTEFELAENIRDFIVASVEGELAGCGALHFYTSKIAEVRSLAVAEKYQKLGIGARIVNGLEGEAREFDLDALFAFTYVPNFFRKLGYAEVDRGELPLKAWKDCLKCPKFQACDEIAMLKPLKEGYQSSRRSSELISLPVLR